MSARAAQGQNNASAVTPLFMLFQPFAWQMVFANWLL